MISWHSVLLKRPRQSPDDRMCIRVLLVACSHFEILLVFLYNSGISNCLSFDGTLACVIIFKTAVFENNEIIFISGQEQILKEGNMI